MKELKPCGTEAAYQRHRRRGEEACDDCVRAHSSLNAERKRERAEAEREERRAQFMVVEGDGSGDLDDPGGDLSELRMLYDVLRTSLMTAEPKYRASISREMRAVLKDMKEADGGGEESFEDAFAAALGNVTRIGG